MRRSPSLSRLHIVREGQRPLARLDAFRLCAFTFISQDDSKPPISQRIGKCAPGGGVTSHSTELCTIPQKFASPDTKRPPAHYATPQDGTSARVAHFSLPRVLPTPKWVPSSRRIYKPSELRPHPFKSPRRPLKEQSASLEKEVPQNQERVRPFRRRQQ